MRKYFLGRTVLMVVLVVCVAIFANAGWAAEQKTQTVQLLFV